MKNVSKTLIFCVFLASNCEKIRNLGTRVLRPKKPTHLSGKNPGFKPGLGLWAQSLRRHPAFCQSMPSAFFKIAGADFWEKFHKEKNNQLSD